MADNTPNPGGVVAWYRERLDELYDLVERAIRRVEPNATFSRTTAIDLDERSTGPYTVESLEAVIPGKPGVRLVPQGIYQIGARGRVDAHSRLGTEVLVWVELGGAALRMTVREGEDVLEQATKPVFPGVPEGWAWTDRRRVTLIPLSEQVFIDRVLPELVA